MTDRLPDFILEDSFDEKPEYWEARALLIGSYKEDPERLGEMLASTAFARARDLDDWRDLADCYPERPLPAGATSKPVHEDVAVRAFILKQAVLRLFHLSAAPPAMRNDLEMLLDSFLENPAALKAKVQALHLAHPNLSWSEICRMAGGANYSQVMKDKRKFIIAERAKSGGSDPSSTP